MASTCASSDTSQRMASVLWPCAASSLAASCAASSFQSASTTEAPDSANALAVARPSPDAAPVTSATLFSKEIFITSSSFFEWVVSRLLVNGVPLALNIGPIHLVGPVLWCDLFKRHGHRLFSVAQDLHDVSCDFLCEMSLLFIRFPGYQLDNNMRHLLLLHIHRKDLRREASSTSKPY